MSKLTFILGKNIHKFVADPRMLKTAACTFYYPELGFDWHQVTGREFTYPKHVDDFVAETLTRALKHLEEGHDVTILTQSETLVNYACLWSEAGKLDKDEIAVHLYEDDNRSFRTCTLDERGHLRDWPFGWFMISDHTV